MITFGIAQACNEMVTYYNETDTDLKEVSESKILETLEFEYNIKTDKIIDVLINSETVTIEFKK